MSNRISESYTPNFRIYIEKTDNKEFPYEASCPSLNMKAYGSNAVNAENRLGDMIQERLEELLYRE